MGEQFQDYLEYRWVPMLRLARETPEKKEQIRCLVRSTHYPIRRVARHYDLQSYGELSQLVSRIESWINPIEEDQKHLESENWIHLAGPFKPRETIEWRNLRSLEQREGEAFEDYFSLWWLKATKELPGRHNMRVLVSSLAKSPVPHLRAIAQYQDFDSYLDLGNLIRRIEEHDQFHAIRETERQGQTSTAEWLEHVREDIREIREEVRDIRHWDTRAILSPTNFVPPRGRIGTLFAKLVEDGVMRPIGESRLQDPPPLLLTGKRIWSNFCEYHQYFDHSTEMCEVLKWDMSQVIGRNVQ
ncbi:hypothetical protein M5689_019001 [Euphorbia peplus]|nr:hypothetical protein M5689_019001 [Euphorbia peplus]